jgi:hypothetical protein
MVIIDRYNYLYPLPILPPRGQEQEAFPPGETGKGVKENNNANDS